MDNYDAIELYYELDIQWDLSDETRERNIALIREALQKAYDAGKAESNDTK